MKNCYFRKIKGTINNENLPTLRTYLYYGTITSNVAVMDTSIFPPAGTVIYFSVTNESDSTAGADAKMVNSSYQLTYVFYNTLLSPGDSVEGHLELIENCINISVGNNNSKSLLVKIWY